MCVCVYVRTCAHNLEGEGNWLVSGLTQYGNPNSSIMGVFSFRLSAAAEDKIKKSWRGKEKENMKLAKEKDIQSKTGSRSWAV